MVKLSCLLVSRCSPNHPVLIKDIPLCYTTPLKLRPSDKRNLWEWWIGLSINKCIACPIVNYILVLHVDLTYLHNNSKVKQYLEFWTTKDNKDVCTINIHSVLFWQYGQWLTKQNIFIWHKHNLLASVFQLRPTDTVTSVLPQVYETVRY